MKLQINLDQIKEAIEGISENFRKKTFYNSFKKAQKEIIELMTRCFETQTDPSGEQWPKYTDDTIKYKERMGITVYAPLLMTSELYDSIKDPSRGEWDIRGNMIAWRPKLGNIKIETHNFGNDRNLMFKSLAPIPPRRFIPNQEEFNKIVENTFQSVLEELKK